MLCTVSTVKDSRANVEQFVRRNLASGADHMFVFLEGDDAEVLDYLRAHPSVSVVVTDESYWEDERPDELTRRQLVNANLVNCVLSTIPGVQWLVHLDGDECLELEKPRLLALPPRVRCVRLQVLEAVSTEHGGRNVQLFKKKLGRRKLEKLVELGVIEAPHNRYYLSGYIIGKAAVRPALDLDMGIHRAHLKGGGDIPHRKDPRFRVLHYDSVSADEFVRKWTSHLHGGAVKLREERAALLRGVSTVLEAGLSDDETHAELRQLYRTHVEDPVDVLLDLGLLVRPRKKWHRYEPQPFAAAERRQVELLMDLLLQQPKSRFRAKGPRDASVSVMRDVRSQLGWRQRRVASRVDAAVERAD